MTFLSAIGYALGDVAKDVELGIEGATQGFLCGGPLGAVLGGASGALSEFGAQGGLAGLFGGQIYKMKVSHAPSQDQQPHQTIGQSNPQMVQALEQFLAQLLDQNQDRSPQSSGGGDQAGGDNLPDGRDQCANGEQDLQQRDIGKLITEAVSMLSPKALAA